MDFRSRSNRHFSTHAFSNPWKYNSYESALDRSWRGSQSPIGRHSPVRKFDRYSSNWDSSSLPLSVSTRSRDKFRRRLSIAGIQSTTESVFSGIEDRFSSPLIPAYIRRSYSYGRPSEHLENFNYRSNYSHSLSPTYTSRNNYTPTSSSFGSAYARPMASIDRHDSGSYSNLFKRSSYVAGYSPQYASSVRRDMSMPIYARYSLMFGQHADVNSVQPRSRSTSRFSNQSFNSSVEKDEPFRSRLFKVPNKYSNDVYEKEPFRNSYDHMIRANAAYKYTSHDDALSRHLDKTYDKPRKSTRELFNEIKNTLDENREKDWLDHSKNEYAKHQRRLSSLLTSYSSNSELKVPDSLETTFTSVSGRSTPIRTIVAPIITIDKGNNESPDQNVCENLTDPVLDKLLEEKEHKDISDRDLTKLLKTDNPEEVARILLDRGESFRPDEISTAILPSGQKALVMTQTKQTAVTEDGHRRKSVSPAASTPLPQSNLLLPTYSESSLSVPGEDQSWADEEIEKFTQLTGEFEESLQTLEHFIARNRSLFPENLIIYQKIVYHKSAGGEVRKQEFPLSRRLSFVDDTNVCAVKVREKLVLPHGCRRNGYDMMEMLRRCYPRFEEIEVVYDDEENIKETLLKHENGKLNPFDEDPGHSTKYDRRMAKPDDEDATKNSPLSVDDDDDDDELLRRCRKNDECLPYFVTKPRAQTTMIGQPARFTCSVSGNPEPSVSWYKNGLPLPRDGRFASTNNFGICSLRISATRPDDKGVYTVEIENSVGAVKTEVDLDILSTDYQSKNLSGNLAFTKIPPYYVHMTEGDPLTLRCKLRGERKPRVTWYKGSKEIYTDDKFRLMSDGDWQFALQIRQLEISDASLYTVMADDGLSSLRHSVEVNVAPKKNLDDTITEYEIVKKMAPVKMAPVFIKELPLQYRLKEGSNLLIGCEVDESDPRPHLVGVEIVEKKIKRSESKDREASDHFQTERNCLDPELSIESWNHGDFVIVPPVK